MDLFQQLNRTRGITVLLITHEMDIAEHAARVMSFRDGRILTDRPVTRRRLAAEEMLTQQFAVV
jgi:putative ABC transport system ATP-binding protein